MAYGAALFGTRFWLRRAGPGPDPRLPRAAAPRPGADPGFLLLFMMSSRDMSRALDISAGFSSVEGRRKGSEGQGNPRREKSGGCRGRRERVVGLERAQRKKEAKGRTALG